MTTPPVQQDPNPNDPNPARSSATLSAFTGQVQRRLGLETESEAEVLTRATLNELGKAVSAGIAQDLTVSLPPELSAELRAQRQSDDERRARWSDGLEQAGAEGFSSAGHPGDGEDAVVTERPMEEDA